MFHILRLWNILLSRNTQFIRKLLSHDNFIFIFIRLIEVPWEHTTSYLFERTGDFSTSKCIDFVKNQAGKKIEELRLSHLVWDYAITWLVTRSQIAFYRYLIKPL